MALWLGFDHIPNNTKKELKSFLADLKKRVKDNSIYFYFAPAYDYAKASGRLQIKITNPDVFQDVSSHFKTKYSLKFLQGKKWVSGPNKEGLNFEFYRSKGLRGTGKLPRVGEKLTSPSTAQQEKGTIVYFREKFKGKNPTLKQISDEIGYAFDDDWFHNFEEQYKALIRGKGTQAFNSRTTIHLDSDKRDTTPKLILNIAKKLGLSDSKDNWNPADIWLLNISENDIRKQTQTFKDLAGYNQWLVEKFDKNELVGVSLKKVGKNSKGKYSVISNDNLPVADLTFSRTIFNSMATNFIYEVKGNLSGLQFRVGYKAGDVTSEKDLKVYIEGRMKGTQVQLGAVSAKLFPNLASQGGFNIEEARRAILKEPEKNFYKYLKRLERARGIQWENKELPEKSLQVKAAAFLLFYLCIFIFHKNEKEFLRDCYYSAIKLNRFSSIHCKLS